MDAVSPVTETPGVGCAAHGRLAGELRALALVALDRLGPLVARLGAEPAGPADAPSCTSCPVCTALATLRGERPELAGRLAEQAAGLLATLREALDEPAPAAAPAPAPRPVQHIRIERADRGDPC